MNTLRRVGLETGRLTQEEWQFIDAEIVEAVRPRLVARRLYPVTSLPDAGFTQIKYYERTDMSQAQISMRGEGGSRDRTVKTPTTLNVPVIAKNFELHWREILSARHGRQPMDVQEAANAGIQVAEEEDKLLLSGEYTGWPALGIQGLSTVTGRNTETSAGAWPANAITDVNDSRAELQADGHQGPFALVGPVDLIKKLDGQISSTVSTYRTFLLDNNLVQAIYESDNVFAADGGSDSVLLVEPNRMNFDLMQAQGLTTFVWQDEDMNILGKVYEVLVPRIRHPTSICEITGVT